MKITRNQYIQLCNCVMDAWRAGWSDAPFVLEMPPQEIYEQVNKIVDCLGLENDDFYKDYILDE